MPAGEDHALIGDLLRAFSLAVDRAVPREMAALMCAAEAESFLDNVADPDWNEPDAVDVADLEVLGVRVFGEVALARFTRSYFTNSATLVLRRENGRWTVCADAEDELSLEQLEDDVWPAAPEGATSVVRRVHALRREPIGRLTVEEVRTLLSQNEGLDVLLPRAVVQLQWDPLLKGDSHPGDLLVAALGVEPAQWLKDPVSLVRMRSAIDKVRGIGDLNEHDAPHDMIWNRISTFLADHPE
jgi:CDI immunity proteins